MKLITDKKQTNKQTPQKELYIFFFECSPRGFVA